MILNAFQDISLLVCFQQKGEILHVLGQLIGFLDEQWRPDRDNYVTIISENIKDGYEYNFRKYPNELVNTYGVPYDLHSIMHLGKKVIAEHKELYIML